MFQYIVRVRGKVYAWGSSNVNVALSAPLLLVINNDAMGDAIEMASETPLGTPVILGTLQPGQCWTIELLGLGGVTVTCATDTTLACAILNPA
jgi:hypothetical protein